MGHMTAREYGRKARDAARQIRVLDRGPAAHRLRLEQHHPAHLPRLGPRGARGVLRPGGRHLAAQLLRQHAAAHRQRQLPLPRDEPGHGAADPRDRRRLRLRAGRVKRSPKRLWLSFDEWNVWYRARGGRFANGQRKFAPRLLEEDYNLEDALLVGGFLNTLLRQAERVRVGCLAQIVNVIAPLVTNETSVLRQSIYYPYAWALKYAHGQGARSARGVRDVPDQGRGPAAGFRPRRHVPVPRRRRHARPRRTGRSAC